jgi:hypothetical protein
LGNASRRGWEAAPALGLVAQVSDENAAEGQELGAGARSLGQPEPALLQAVAALVAANWRSNSGEISDSENKCA